MEYLRFVGMWFKRSFSGRLGLAERIEFLVTVVFGFAAAIRFRDNPTISILLATIPLAILVVTITVGFALAPYWLYREIEREKKSLEARIDVASVIEKKLQRLMNLRTVGVEMRNGGLQIASEDGLAVWVIEVRGWRDAAQSVIAEISPIDARMFETLNWFGAPSFKGINDEHVMQLRILHRRLEIIERVAEEHAARVIP